nr:cytochrome P450 [Pseudomonadota bacterium]
MTHGPQADWDPRAESVLRDQRATYDEMRERCPVAYSEFLQWSIFRHEDVTRVLRDPETFSNAVSQHVSVPNGMDPPQHTHYRRIVEPYFSAERLQAFEPGCRRIAADLVQSVLASGEGEVMQQVALPFAARAQCVFLGWPPELHEQLTRWTQRNAEATRNQDRQTMAAIAAEFKGLVDGILSARLNNEQAADTDVTAALMRELVHERPLSKDELASILRNWTVGEVGTISAAVGILLHFLATHPEQWNRVREQSELLPPAIDEILRLHGPLASNRRLTTRPVEI